MSREEEIVKINLNCTKIPDEIFGNSFGNQDRSVLNSMENYKESNGIARVHGQSFPILINIDNQTTHNIKDITVEIFANVKAHKNIGDTSNSLEQEFPIDFSYSHILNSKESWNGLLFDMSGFFEVLMKLGRINYDIINNGNTDVGSKAKSNTPLLINIEDLTNQYHGYRNQEEMQNHLLLKNYIQNSLPARGFLLKVMFRMLKEITKNRSFEFEGETYSYGGEEIPAIQGMLQIDIIAKIMMYIEDLIVLLEGIRETDGNYYKLLDRETEDDLDLGTRIGQFFNNKDNFTTEEWRKMLSYLNPYELITHSDAITKLIELNVEAFKNFINYIHVFSNTHHQIFRRYKHAGFPFKPGYLSQQPYPLTSKKFDSYSMVFTGANPLVDIVPLPYADDVIESYLILLPTLQKMINHIVYNKMECIKRRIDRVIPSTRYSAPGTFTPTEISELELAINQYNKHYPNRAYDDVYEFPITTNNVKDMTWYINLENSMEKWRKMKEIQNK